MNNFDYSSKVQSELKTCDFDQIKIISLNNYYYYNQLEGGGENFELVETAETFINYLVSGQI